MTKDKMYAKESREIDMIDLVVEVLTHWRGLIIAVVIGGLLLGGYSLYGSLKANKAAKLAAAAAEQEMAKFQSDKEFYEAEAEKVSNRIAALEGALSGKDLAGAAKLLGDREQYLIQKSYMDNSVLMKADAMNLPTGTVILRVVADQSVISSLKKTYETILTSPEMYDALKEKLGYGSEISELVRVYNPANSTKLYGSSSLIEDADENANDAALVFVFNALTEDDCRALEDAFIEFANAKAGDYQKSFGSHQLMVVDATVSTIYSEELKNDQMKAFSNLATLENSIATGYDALTAEGKEYYNLLCKQEDNELEIAEREEIVAQSKVTIPPVTISKKKLLIGLAGGFFVYAFIICVAYVFSHKIKDSDDFNTAFGVNQLGKIYRETRSVKRTTRLDKAIYSLKRRGRKKVSFDEASSIVAVNTSFTASKGGYKKLGIITADKEDALTGKLSDALKVEGVDGVVLSEPLYNGQEMSALKDVDAAVIIAKSGVSRYDDLWDVIEVLDNQKVEILGGIMA